MCGSAAISKHSGFTGGIPLESHHGEHVCWIHVSPRQQSKDTHIPFASWDGPGSVSRHRGRRMSTHEPNRLTHSSPGPPAILLYTCPPHPTTHTHSCTLHYYYHFCAATCNELKLLQRVSRKERRDVCLLTYLLTYFVVHLKNFLVFQHVTLCQCLPSS